jgi:acyl carrier protein
MSRRRNRVPQSFPATKPIRSSFSKATRGRVHTPKGHAKQGEYSAWISHEVLWSAMRSRIALAEVRISDVCSFDRTRNLRQNPRSFMSESDLRAQIKEMLIKNLMLQVTPEQIGNELPLFGPDGLGLDSIDALELVVSMEKTFGVGVPNSDVAGKALRTVNTIHDYILEKRAAAA